MEMWMSYGCSCPFARMPAQPLTSGGARDAAASLSETRAVHHHPSLIGLLPGLSHHVGRSGRVVVTALGCTKNAQSLMKRAFLDFLKRNLKGRVFVRQTAPPASRRLADRLTDWFAGPLSLAVAQADTLQHVASGFMGSPPGVADLVRGSALVAAV